MRVSTIHCRTSLSCRYNSNSLIKQQQKYTALFEGIYMKSFKECEFSENFPVTEISAGIELYFKYSSNFKINSGYNGDELVRMIADMIISLAMANLREDRVKFKDERITKVNEIMGEHITDLMNSNESFAIRARDNGYEQWFMALPNYMNDIMKCDALTDLQKLDLQTLQLYFEQYKYKDKGAYPLYEELKKRALADIGPSDVYIPTARPASKAAVEEEELNPKAMKATKLKPKNL